ncbi:multidrug effflux MFS transporter [Fictibacillus enclensis]|uniref:multidrug effflux MFS transporter n=1 Tax=Fictibacillus enclensis TaxID=1017270 RepID=UPI0024C09C6A|nr:multidrug effflux MFS transporter [Fictibacillus enclensis]WHY74758.1 multidrug effflux MFS transporter [Fictibacillus enclensis]
MNQTQPVIQQEPASKRIWLAVILGSMTAIGPLSIDMYLPALPSLTHDLHTSSSSAQLSLTACLLGIAVGQLFVGPISDRRGRKKPLLIALAFYALSSLLCVFSPNIALLIFLRFVQGASGAGGIVISRAMVRDLYSGPEMTKFVSLLMLINGVAPILAPVAGGQLLQFTSWRGVFVVLCLLSLLMLFGAVFGLRETLQEKNQSSGGIRHTLNTYKKLLGDRRFMGYAASQGFVMAAMFAYISGSPFVIQNVFGASPQTFSLFFAINGLGIIIASQIAGKLAGKVSETAMLRSGLLLALTGGLLLLIVSSVTESLFGILCSLFLSVSSVGIVSTASFSLAMQNQQRAAGSASALLGLLPFILGGAAAPLVGLSPAHPELSMAAVIAVCELLAIVLYLALTKGISKKA